MSLKAFHLVFVAASILLGVFVAGWAFVQWRNGNGAEYAGYGLISLSVSAGLIGYARIVLRKLKHISYL